MRYLHIFLPQKFKKLNKTKKEDKLVSNLQLVQSEKFGNVECDFYKNEADDLVMTADQLGSALGYSNPRESINKLVSRNKYLRSADFSAEVKMTSPGGRQETRIFNEDGIYEVTMLSKTSKAREFRAWVRKILKSLRKGEYILVKPQSEQDKLQIQKQRAEAMLLNARTRQAKLLLDMKKDKNLSSISLELLGINALEVLTNKQIGYRPEVEKTYSATDISQELGVSKQKIGSIANAHGLKTNEYGITVLDKSPYSNKQVETFRYNEKSRNRLWELLR